MVELALIDGEFGEAISIAARLLENCHGRREIKATRLQAVAARRPAIKRATSANVGEDVAFSDSGGLVACVMASRPPSCAAPPRRPCAQRRPRRPTM